MVTIIWLISFFTSYSSALEVNYTTVNFAIHFLQPYSPECTPFHVHIKSKNDLHSISNPITIKGLTTSHKTKHYGYILTQSRIAESTLALVQLKNDNITQDIFAVSIKYNSSSHLKIITDRYRLKVLASEVKMKVITPDFQQDLGGCNCVTRNCACCESIDIPYFHHHLCANISYNARDIGIEVSLGIDGHFYTQEISARNPPPICFAIPGWHDVIGVCMAFTKLDISKKILSGCIDIEAEVLHLRIFRVKLGCFSMPI